jgi:diguanylate cyclase (GGDEF)-like protein/PAS domain S-box-containing protein
MNTIDLLDYHLDNSPLGVIEWDAQFRVKRWSKTAESIFGWKEVEIANSSPFDWHFIHVDDIKSVSTVMEDLIVKIVSNNISFNRNYTKDGRVVFCEWYNSILFDQEGKLLSVLSLVLDVTKSVELEQEVSLKQPAKTSLDLLGDAFIVTDLNYRVTYLNYHAKKLTGFTDNQAKGRQLNEIFRLRNKSIQEIITDAVPTNNLLSFGDNYWLINSQEQACQIEFTVTHLYTNNQALKGYLVIFTNLERNNSIVSKLKYQAERDQVTGMFNRIFFQQELTRAIASVKNSQITHCLCYLDLDQFQIINDTCGHNAGDKLLKEVSSLLIKKLENKSILARLGGNEFGILLLYQDLNDAYTLIKEVKDKIKNLDFIYEDTILRITASFGLIEINEKSPESSLVLSAADAACFAAKEKGGNKIQIYQSSDAVLKRMRSDRQWTIKINEGIKNNRFCLYHQKIETAQNHPQQPNISEILLRLVDKEGNIIRPANFIPAAERYGLMTDLDFLVVQMLTEYIENQKITNNYYLVNLSGTTIGKPKFLQFLKTMCGNNFLNPELICFEITETAAIKSFPEAKQFIQEVKNLGFKFALDDFGTGMSSFNYIKKLPLDYIKIDGSFIKNVINNRLDYTIVESIVKIAEILAIKTVAEFVENQQIREQVAAMGIDYVQGYGVSKVYPLI